MRITSHCWFFFFILPLKLMTKGEKPEMVRTQHQGSGDGAVAIRRASSWSTTAHDTGRPTRGSPLRTARRLLRTLLWGDPAGAPGPRRLQGKGHTHRCPTSTPTSVQGHPSNFYLSLSFKTQCCAVLCLVTQLCPTLCDTMDCSQPGSSVHEDSPDSELIFILEN